MILYYANVTSSLLTDLFHQIRWACFTQRSPFLMSYVGITITRRVSSLNKQANKQKNYYWIYLFWIFQICFWNWSADYIKCISGYMHMLSISSLHRNEFVYSSSYNFIASAEIKFCFHIACPFQSDQYCHHRKNKLGKKHRIWEFICPGCSLLSFELPGCAVYHLGEETDGFEEPERCCLAAQQPLCVHHSQKQTSVELL